MAAAGRDGFSVLWAGSVSAQCSSGRASGRVRRGGILALSGGGQLRDWVSVDDVVSGLLAVARAELASADSIDIGTGEGIPLREVVQMLFDLSGGEGRPLFGALPYRRGEDMNMVADADRTERLIGWRARTGMEEGLRALVSAAAS